MSIVLLRTLTRKSIIGFGLYVDMSVQNLIDLCKHKELLNIYYTCRNIDFTQDIKDELCIAEEREIDKKKPSESRYAQDYKAHISKCLYLMLNRMDDEKYNINRRTKLALSQQDKKQKKRNDAKFSNFISTKGWLKDKNQGHRRKK